MGTVSVPNTFSASTTISSSEVNSNFTTIYNEFNGSISAANLATDAITTAKITNSNVTTAKIADGAVTNAKLDTAAGGIGAAWADWTPTFNNFTKGSATVAAKYQQIGKTVNYKLSITLSSSTMGTNPTFSLPVTSVSPLTSNVYIGEVRIEDTGTVTHPGKALHTSTTVATLTALDANSTFVRESTITSSSPMTWEDTDIFSVYGTYEAA